jgi:hypothetical protein
MECILMNRFFIVDLTSLDFIRAEMDSESGYPNSEADTWFSPADDCPKDKDGNCLLACIPEIAERIAPVAIRELTQAEYEAALPAVTFTAPAVPEGL